MKKLLALVMCMAMLFGIAACSGEKDKEGQTAEPTASASQEPETTVSAEEPAEFSATFLKNDWHGDPNDMEVLKKLEEEANVKVHWEIYPNATWGEKKNLLLNSGDLPDVFYMNAVNAVDIEKYGPQGLFVDLTDLIPQYAPRLQAVLDDMPTFKAICISPTDGKMYTIARAAERPANSLVGQMYFYKPWLDQLNLSIPTTSDEFYTVLKAFKEKDPNGNGQADELPFAFANSEPNYSISSLFGMFGYGYGGVANNGSMFNNVDGEAVFVPATENFKKAIKYFNKLFQEELFSMEDYATVDTKLLNSKLHSDPVTVGSFIAFNSNIVVPAERLDDYVRIEAPMKGPGGDQLWMLAASKNNISGTQFVMTKEAENQEAIMRWLDAHFDPETSIQLFLGPIGVNLLDNDNDGKLEYAPVPEGQSYSEYRYGNCPVHVPCVIQADQWGKDVDVMEEDVERLDYMQTTLKPYLKQSFVYNYPNADESQYMLTKGKDINDYVVKTQAKWLTEGGIEEEWDGFLKKLNDMGIDEYTEIMQNQIDRFEEYGK